MTRSEMLGYDAWLDPHVVAVIHALLRQCLATATLHLDLEEHDSFYRELALSLSRWQTNLHVLPEIMQLDHGQKVSALEILHALEVFLVPIPPDDLVDASLFDQ